MDASGTSSRSQERKVSTSVSAPTHTTSSASTRCCRVPEPIDSRLVCVVLSASQTEPLPVSTSARSSSLSELVTLVSITVLRGLRTHYPDITSQTAPPPSRPSAAHSTSSQVAKRSSSPRTGASPLSAATTTSRSARLVSSVSTAATSSSCQSTAQSPTTCAASQTPSSRRHKRVSSLMVRLNEARWDMMASHRRTFGRSGETPA